MIILNAILATIATIAFLLLWNALFHISREVDRKAKEEFRRFMEEYKAAAHETDREE